MNNIKLRKFIYTNFIQLLNEENDSYFEKDSFTPTEKSRFDTAIYLHYVESRENFKYVKQDKFYDIMNSHKNNIDRIQPIEFDLKRIYRLADEKYVWWSKNHRKLGEIWVQHPNDIASYWVDEDLIS